MILKLYLGKAYDYKNWDFLDYMLARKGLANKLRTWIHDCLAPSHFSILINSSAKGFFPSLRGWRQEDPISPFLFTLVGDPFNQILKNGENHLIQGFRVGKELITISHLHYADDILILLDCRKEHLLNLMYCKIKINWKKKKLSFRSKFESWRV